MEIKIIPLCFEVDDERLFADVQKLICGKSEDDLDIFKLRITDDRIIKRISSFVWCYGNKTYYDDSVECIIDFQKGLPDNIKISCCQSCKYGNFCVYGNNENEIFCLIDFPPLKDVYDLIEIFDSKYSAIPAHELTHFCQKYQRATKNNDYYSYNSWDLHF